MRSLAWKALGLLVTLAASTLPAVAQTYPDKR